MLNSIHAAGPSQGLPAPQSNWRDSYAAAEAALTCVAALRIVYDGAQLLPAAIGWRSYRQQWFLLGRRRRLRIIERSAPIQPDFRAFAILEPVTTWEL